LHNRPTGKIKQGERSKKLLVYALTNAEVTFQQLQSYKRKKLQDFARIHGTNLYENKEQILLGWWEGGTAIRSPPSCLPEEGDD
jgi:hypothetical protein